MKGIVYSNKKKSVYIYIITQKRNETKGENCSKGSRSLSQKWKFDLFRGAPDTVLLAQDTVILTPKHHKSERRRAIFSAKKETEKQRERKKTETMARR